MLPIYKNPVGYMKPAQVMQRLLQQDYDLVIMRDHLREYTKEEIKNGERVVDILSFLCQYAPQIILAAQNDALIWNEDEVILYGKTLLSKAYDPQVYML